jgi:hypothetical protein
VSKVRFFEQWTDGAIPAKDAVALLQAIISRIQSEGTDVGFKIRVEWKPGTAKEGA